MWVGAVGIGRKKSCEIIEYLELEGTHRDHQEALGAAGHCPSLRLQGVSS